MAIDITMTTIEKSLSVPYFGDGREYITPESNEVVGFQRTKHWSESETGNELSPNPDDSLLLKISQAVVSIKSRSLTAEQVIGELGSISKQMDDVSISLEKIRDWEKKLEMFYIYAKSNYPENPEIANMILNICEKIETKVYYQITEF